MLFVFVAIYTVNIVKKYSVAAGLKWLDLDLFTVSHQQARPQFMADLQCVVPYLAMNTGEAIFHHFDDMPAVQELSSDALLSILAFNSAIRSK